MITLSSDVDRVTVDAAIDEAFAALGHRMRGRGETFGALADAIRRAGTGGKRFRPELVVRAFSALGGRADECPALLPVAVAFELLHTAFIVHDDVIDRDTERRGIPNIGGEFRARGRADGADAAGAADLGDAAGILAGDLLLHEAQRTIALAPVAADVRRSLLDLLDDAVIVSAAAELADVQQSIVPLGAARESASVGAGSVGASSIGPESVGAELEWALATSHDKTAVYSFSAPLRAGALIAGADAQTDAALERFGGRLGLAFQLVDDLIGAFGTHAQAGRTSGADLAMAKRTSLVALAQGSARWPVVRDALALAGTGPVAVRRAQRELDRSGARARLQALIRDILADARSEAAVLPPRLRALLDELVDRVAERVP